MNHLKSYPTPSKIRYRLERVWLRRWFRKLTSSLIFLAIFLIILSILIFNLRNIIRFKDIEEYIKNYVIERPELSVTNIKIKNANPNLTNQIRAILQMSFPISSIKININNLKKIINNIDSVETSNIRITDNGILEVEIFERKPVLVFRENNQLTVVDINGKKIDEIFSRLDREDLPLIVGIDGNLHVKEALEIYNTLFHYLLEVSGLIRISQRRWDVILANNKRIKLPERNTISTLQKFLSSDDFKIISSDNFSVIDLRFANRIILRQLSKDKENSIIELN